MHHASRNGEWRDRVSDDEADFGTKEQRWTHAAAEEALALAGVVVECAVRPVLAMTAALPSLLHFEIRERAERHSARARR